MLATVATLLLQKRARRSLNGAKSSTPPCASEGHHVALFDGRFNRGVGESALDEGLQKIRPILI